MAWSVIPGKTVNDHAGPDGPVQRKQRSVIAQGHNRGTLVDDLGYAMPERAPEVCDGSWAATAAAGPAAMALFTEPVAVARQGSGEFTTDGRRGATMSAWPRTGAEGTSCEFRRRQSGQQGAWPRAGQVSASRSG